MDRGPLPRPRREVVALGRGDERDDPNHYNDGDDDRDDPVQRATSAPWIGGERVERLGTSRPQLVVEVGAGPDLRKVAASLALHTG